MPSTPFGVPPALGGVELSPRGSGLSPTLGSGDATLDLAPDMISSADAPFGSSVRKRDSFVDATFYDAKSTNLPVFGKRVGEADIIEGPMEAEPQVC